MAQPPPEGEEPGDQVAEVVGEEEGAEGEGGVGQHAHGEGRQAERGEGGPDGGALRCNRDKSQYWLTGDCVEVFTSYPRFGSSF